MEHPQLLIDNFCGFARRANDGIIDLPVPDYEPESLASAWSIRWPSGAGQPKMCAAMYTECHFKNNLSGGVGAVLAADREPLPGLITVQPYYRWDA